MFYITGLSTIVIARTFLFMTVLGATIVFITMYSCVDGLFIYHKFRNVCDLILTSPNFNIFYLFSMSKTEKELQRHTSVFLGCVCTASKVVLFASVIYFFFVSKCCVGYILTIASWYAVVNVMHGIINTNNIYSDKHHFSWYCKIDEITNSSNNTSRKQDHSTSIAISETKK